MPKHVKETAVPDINPTPQDVIEVMLHVLPNPVTGNKEPIAMLARIMTRDQSGKYQIEIPGVPPLRGLVNIDEYEWSHDLKRWTRKTDIQKPHEVSKGKK